MHAKRNEENGTNEKREKKSGISSGTMCLQWLLLFGAQITHIFMRVSFGVSCYCVYFVAFDFGQHFSVSNVLNMQVTVVTSEPERNISSSATAIRD